MCDYVKPWHLLTSLPVENLLQLHNTTMTFKTNCSTVKKQIGLYIVMLTSYPAGVVVICIIISEAWTFFTCATRS